ncbi:hypothetical protein ACRE_088000 [Hapsidospora chrysogenum ATCC 11550]|uniref:Uncharacterized protein n=1 Tax=Hapsidospora chrysogenum (strain ATCC 11550 / CBS 779.69 / DSM 880 / IAM 14645 / JCM 23072 / IMI 49137) TaxID=857340 RepID=A0A086STT1_HAPC1|nr:hypothetical protein ACRE_088000 [Hapsidospora chrysogenum ATCC 11550]
MFARGRGGPRQTTPANARHYSYECKASTQDRPYVSRPSRSKQLRNPKLVPKLTSDTLEPLEKKYRKGIADVEIAKQEAERARKRELEERDDELIRSAPKRQRRRHLSPGEESDRDVRSGGRRDDSRSISPPRRRRSVSGDSRSPPPRLLSFPRRVASERSRRKDSEASAAILVRVQDVARLASSSEGPLKVA